MQQRAIPRRRATLALLAIVAALATTIPLAGATHGAGKPVTQYFLCPPIC
jgi:hypothetical protein